MLGRLDGLVPIAMDGRWRRGGGDDCFEKGRSFGLESWKSTATDVPRYLSSGRRFVRYGKAARSEVSTALACVESFQPRKVGMLGERDREIE